jgi:phospholipid/cholesterol/gamma-HCH transport system substrate-binding protein
VDVVSRSLSRGQAVLLGAAVLAGLSLCVFGLFAVGSRHWPGGDTFTATVGFRDVGGVEPGTRVRIQGLDAGEVEAVEPPADAGGPVTVRLRLAGRFRRLVGDPATARVRISSEGLWGGKFVSILPGRPGKTADGDMVLRSDPAPEMTSELAQAAGKLNRVLDQVQGTLDDVRRGQGTLGRLVRDGGLYTELTRTADRAGKALGEVHEAVAEVKAAVQEVRGGKGTVGQLVQSKEAYSEALKTLDQTRAMVRSVKQDADAIKAMPIIRNYVTDRDKLLNRPDCSWQRRWFADRLLFLPGRAVLTDRGRRELAAVGRWLAASKRKGSEVVVASYAAPGENEEFAQTLTQKQSEVVCNYLTSNYKVHKTGWWWWSRRAVRPVGCGTLASPIPSDARKNLPPARVEVLLFIPQN